MVVGCGDTIVVERVADSHPEASFYEVDTAFTIEAIVRYRWQRHSDRLLSGLVTWQGGEKKASLLRAMLVADAGVSRAFARVGIALPGLSHYAVCVKSV